QLAAIWEEVLQVSQAGIHHNFFEQGGNSFSAIKLATAIRNKLQTELAVKDIFRYPTIAQLSEVLGDDRKSLSIPRLAPAAITGKIPLSPAQKRLWIIH
ncbi:phosphopantetheine-binding protein, partial [Chitinophaga qingshengii]